MGANYVVCRVPRRPETFPQLGQFLQQHSFLSHSEFRNDQFPLRNHHHSANLKRWVVAERLLRVWGLDQLWNSSQTVRFSNVVYGHQ